ncbi:MAG: hypothetical protein GXO37_01680 [Chloroflexi bacterium]|nr:hypothetical protein [Chloroflexota bacterium]
MTPRSSWLRSRLALLGWGTLYLALFVWVYAHHIVPAFSFQGFAYHPSLERTLVSAFLILSPLLWMPSVIARPSTFAVWFLYFVVYVPAIVVSFHILELGFPFPWFFLWLWFGLLLLASLVLLPVVRIPKIRLPQTWLTWGLLGLWTAGYALFFKAFGLRVLPSLRDIYRVRLAARAVVSSQGRLFGYLLRWFSNVINPFLVILGLRRRRWTWLGAGVLGQALIFTFDATKSTLMSVPYLLGLYGLLRWKRWRVPATTLFQGVAALFGSTLFLDGVLGSRLLTTYVLRRIFYVPGLLTAFYLEYFSTHPKWYWAHTLIGRLFGLLPPAGTSAPGPGFLIGEAYFQNPAGNANVNFWADAFANLGNPGVILVTLGLFLLLWLYDSLSWGHDRAVAFLLLAMPVFALTNTSLLTALLTHGWIPALLLLWLWPTEPEVSPP